MRRHKLLHTTVIARSVATKPACRLPAGKAGTGRQSNRSDCFAGARNDSLGRSAFFILILLGICLLLCGFSFYSKLKNEEGNRFFKKGQVGKAKSAYEKALKSEPQAEEIAFNLGNAYYKEESFEKSLDSYTEAAKEPQSPRLQSQAFYNLGNTLVRRKETDKAVEFYKQALRLNPKDEDAKYNLELLTKRSEEEKKQDKKEDQKQDKQNQGGSQGSDSKDQQNKEEGSQEEKDKEGKPKDSQKAQGSQEEQGKSEQQKSSESKENKEKEEQKTQAGQASQEKEEKEEPSEKGGAAQGSEEEKDRQEETGQEGEVPAQTPKTQAEIRAEQILNALENQEKQVLKMEGGQKRPVRRVERVVEKDW